LLVVDATARPGVDVATLEREVAGEVDRMVESGVTDPEVARALAQVETDFVAAMESAQGRADRLSMLATYFDEPARVNSEPARYQAVTPAAVTAFAQAYLHAANRASLVYVPKTDA
jgi:zinc protease